MNREVHEHTSIDPTMSTNVHSLRSTTIVRATPSQTRITRLDTFPQWGRPKGFDETMYLKRDEVMELEEWSLGDRFVTW
jgi:hypothetical protein